MTLHLTPTLLEQMLTHCYSDHPQEACGLLPGRDDLPTRLVRMRNVSDTPELRFAFDMDQQLDVFVAMDDAGEDPIVVYHSHTASEAAPSGTDRAHFTDPEIHYVIVSTRHTLGEWPRLRSWRFVNGSLVEEAVVGTASCG